MVKSNRDGNKLVLIKEFMESGGDLYTAKSDLIKILEPRLNKINKVLKVIRDFEERVDLDYRQIVFEGINIAKDQKAKGKGREI